MTERRRSRPLLGTFVEIGATAGTPALDAAISAAFNAIEKVHRLMSFQDPASELSRLNASDGDWVTLDPLTVRVLRLALAMTRASAGLFNCTVGGRLVAAGALPNHGGPMPLDCGHADDVELEGGGARLRRPVRVTLDGVAKGFAVDLAVRTLRAHGIASGWVNAGGDIRVFGEAALPVHRREADGRLTPLGDLRGGAIATSQTREQVGPRFPALIVSGDQGTPTAGVWTVLAAMAWRADALTKVAGLAPPSERAAMIARLGGYLVVPMMKEAA